MTLPLVVGVDGSEAGLWAADWAADEAALHGLELRIVHASLWERYEGPVFPPAPEVPTEHPGTGHRRPRCRTGPAAPPGREDHGRHRS